MNSQSLKNATLAPGWRPDEVEVLKVALMKFGIGRWRKIMQSGCLPGKTPSQLSSQTQRLLGQQSLAEYLHLHLDIDKVAKHNQNKTGVKRKSNCIVNTGKNPDPEELERLREFNREQFGLQPTDIRQLQIPKISLLSQILSFQGDPLTKLKQLYELKGRIKKQKI
ncbi:unnamed protein product [Blepharisma stoltei]|uniref:Myb-like domain-containing protein n=1 Tax=Blepharisma stoltei TaxID=1481888 RepID=A0AAU9J576_9CILI|nr:unnamed protein product [Blepharisma stoltei]